LEAKAYSEDFTKVVRTKAEGSTEIDPQTTPVAGEENNHAGPGLGDAEPSV
jgi:hypothetical protein